MTTPTSQRPARAKYNPEQPRDKDGKWGTGGGEAGKIEDAVKQWTADGNTANYTGSMGINRADMPQLSGTVNGTYRPSAEVTPKFIAHLRAKGATVTAKRVPAEQLKPTQATGDLKAIRGIADDLKSGKLKDTKTIMVSSDNHVLDGHHNWAGRVLADSEGGRKDLPAGMPVQQVDMPMSKLLGEASAFSKDEGLPSRKPGEFAAPKAKLGDPQPNDSMDQYRNADGDWKPERAELHQKIIKSLAGDAEPQDKPIATFFGGGPASGKSALAGPGNAVKIDPDEIKAQLPEYQQMTTAGDPQAAAYTHEESSFISASAVAQARAKKLNYTLDGTGDSSYAKMKSKVDAARAAGHEVHGKYVTADTDEAVNRAMKRAEHTGRMVPEAVIRSTHASVSQVFGQAVKDGLFDTVELWDNNGAGAARLIVSGHGKNVTVHDAKAYQSFLDKAKS
jgi:predicted ABC-type ATPase